MTMQMMLVLMFFFISFDHASAYSPKTISCELNRAQVKESTNEMRKYFPQLRRKSLPTKEKRCWTKFANTATAEFAVRHRDAVSHIDFEILFTRDVHLKPTGLGHQPVFDLKVIAAHIRRLLSDQPAPDEPLLCYVRSEDGSFEFTCGPLVPGDESWGLVKGRILSGKFIAQLTRDGQVLVRVDTAI